MVLNVDEEYERLKRVEQELQIIIKNRRLGPPEKASQIKPIRKKTDKLIIGCIFDIITSECFQPEKNKFPIDFLPIPLAWREFVENVSIDILMIESAWRGNNDEWSHKIARKPTTAKNQIDDLIDYCNKRNIPTVFWNKEDPIHYDKFISVAKQCRYIFTTDNNMITHYKADAGHDRIWVLPFAAQPTIHNPIDAFYKNGKSVFAGTYYVNNYPERGKFLNDVFALVEEKGLDIFDRNLNLNKPELAFPDKWKPFIKGTLDYKDIGAAYKKYKFLINVNSIEDSPTMFSRRALESMASGTPVISNYSLGIRTLLSDESIQVFEDFNKLSDYYHNLSSDQLAYDKVLVRGVREVLTHHKYSDRLKFVFSRLHLENIKSAESRIGTLCLIRSKEDANNALTILKRQKYRNSRNYMIVYNFNDWRSSWDELLKNGCTCYTDAVIDSQSDIGDYFFDDYLAYISTTNYYGREYLGDLILATSYSNSAIVGKSTFYCCKNGRLEVQNPGFEFRYTDEICPDRSLIKKASIVNRSSRQFFSSVINNDRISVNEPNTMFSIDRFNFIENCHWESDRDNKASC